MARLDSPADYLVSTRIQTRSPKFPHTCRKLIEWAFIAYLRREMSCLVAGRRLLALVFKFN
jgi:hypothetical protein